MLYNNRYEMYIHTGKKNSAASRIKRIIFGTGQELIQNMF